MPDPVPPYHLDLLFRSDVATLRNTEHDLVFRVSTRALGTATFEGLLVGDPFDAAIPSLGELTWPGPGDLPRSAEAFSLVAALETGPLTAALALRFDAAPVVRWVKAGVTSDTDCHFGGFASAGLRELLARKDQSDRLLAEWGSVEGSDSGLVMECEGQSVVVATSGYGEGGFDVWWGLSDAGRPVCAAIDFEVLSESVFEEVRIPLPLRLGSAELFGLPGVHLDVGLFGRRRPRLVADGLLEGQFVYARVVEGSGAMQAPRVQSGRVDLRPFQDARELIVRLVKGSKAIERVA